ncbi:hypothetical protein NFI96_008819, partial [Prochilodus magdalenae]
MERQKGLCGPLKGSSRKKKTLIWPSWLTGPPRSPTGIAQLSCQWADSSGQRFQSSLNPGWTDIVKLKEEEQKMRQRSRVHFNKSHRAQQLTTLTPGDHVWIKDTKEKGTVISQANTPRSYVIDSPRGILRRNRNHLVTTPVPPAEQTTSPEPDLPADQPINAEFKRITTMPLRSRFLSQLDFLSESLLRVFAKRSGEPGKKLKNIAATMSDDTDARRESLIKGLCIYLNESPDVLVQEYM